MDALDEFFRVWSEPEAWCERCKTSPAIHVVVQDDDHMDGMIITYAYIWEPDTQAQIPVCRSCSEHYLDSLGTSEFRYARRPEEKMVPACAQLTLGDRLRQILWAVAVRIRAWLKIGGRRQPSELSQSAEHYSGSQW